MNEIIKKLEAPITIEAIQRTKKADTKKGYDTTGYGYQYMVDRFNEVLGSSWGYDWEIIHEQTGNYKTGQPYIEITVSCTIWLENKENARCCVGGHTSINYYDALKGAITNSFKKTAAFWGVGADAFRGVIDDDGKLPDHDDNKMPKQVEKKSEGKIPTIEQLLKKIEAIKDLDAIGTAFDYVNTIKSHFSPEALTIIINDINKKEADLKLHNPFNDDSIPFPEEEGR